MARHGGLPKRKMTVEERVAFESQRLNEDLTKRKPRKGIKHGFTFPVEEQPIVVSSTPGSAATALKGDTMRKRVKDATQ